MRLVLAISFLLAFAAATVVQPARAQAVVDRPITEGTPSAIPLRIKQVGDGLFMITGRGGNSIVMADPQGLLLVDTKVMYDQFCQFASNLGSWIQIGRPFLG